jgi:hypothetical protein
MEKMWWPKDGSDEWLSRVDGRVALALLTGIRTRRSAAEQPLEPVLEVGVWKGAWSSVVLMNVTGALVQGVDPYPGRPDYRDGVIRRLGALGVGDRFFLADSLADLPPEAIFSMIHLDGEHSERALLEELDYAVNHLTPDGVVIVDDFRHAWFPGVASALFKAVHTGPLRVFAVSGNKAYLALVGQADERYRDLSNHFGGPMGVPVWTHWRQWDDDVEYIQRPDIAGQRVLICGLHRPAEVGSKGRRLARGLLPPIVYNAASRVRQWLSIASK